MIDLGSGFAYGIFSWDPDRELNPQYAEIPSVPMAGIILYKDEITIGSCWFDTPEVRAIPWSSPERKFWQLVSLEPLHLEPSIQTFAFRYGDVDVPGYHGFIRNGQWVSA